MHSGDLFYTLDCVRGDYRLPFETAQLEMGDMKAVGMIDVPLSIS